jgi:non-ribosomal peptide synthetase component F
VGTPIAGRTRIEIEQLMGLFVNTLPMRTQVLGDLTFREVLRQVREVCLSAYEHQDLPFEKLVEELNPERHLGYQPIFQVFFVLQDNSASFDRMNGIELLEIYRKATGNKFDLGLGLWDDPNAIDGDIEYNADIFTPETIARIAGYFETLLTSIVANPDQPVARLEMISPAEREYLFEHWKAPAGDFPAISVPEVFERQAQLTPDAVALTWRDEQISFAELDRRANQMAHFLRRQGITPEVCVGVCLERSPDLAVALLGVMKSGGVYLPFDPTSPEERRAFMLGDAQAPLVLTQTSLRHQFVGSQARIVCLDADRAVIAQEPGDRLATSPHPEDAAYVIYTSGSTGTPKGVVVPHRALVDRIYSIKSRYGLNARDRLLQFVSMSFDVSLEEIFPRWPKSRA